MAYKFKRKKGKRPTDSDALLSITGAFEEEEKAMGLHGPGEAQRYATDDPSIVAASEAQMLRISGHKTIDGKGTIRQR